MKESEFIPTTELGKKLWEQRRKIVESGEPLLSRDEILKMLDRDRLERLREDEQDLSEALLALEDVRINGSISEEEMRKEIGLQEEFLTLEKDHWIYKNPEALACLEQGLKDVEEGRVSELDL